MAKNEAMQKIKEGMNKCINSIYFVIFIGILMLLKTILFYNNTIAINEEIGTDTIIGTASFIIALICIICTMPNRGRTIVTIVMNIIISTVLFFDNVYYTYSNSFLSVAQITNLQYGEEIMSTLPMVIEAKQILYFLDVVVILLLFLFRIIKIYKKDNKTKKELIVKCISGIIGIIIFVIIGSQYVEKGKQKSYNKDMQMREATIFGYHIYDIESAINIKSQTKYKNYNDMIKDYEELKDEYKKDYGEPSYNLKGALKGKNIVIVQLESVQEFVLYKEINGTQITPNLNKFLTENIEFTNMHMQSYSTTADSEHTTITSLYPMENGMSFSKYYTNTYDDLFKTFNKAHYYTSYMHGNYPYFWNRGNVYGRLGLNDLSLKEQFDDLSENINGDLSDELLYKQGVQKLKQFNQPFISYIVAASSHTPYLLEGLQDRSKVTVDVGKYKDTYFGNYIEAVNYADYAFGVFLEKLKDEGLYDNTAILVYGDHNGLNMYNEEMVDFLQHTDNDLTDVKLKLNYTRVVCGMKIPGMQNIKIDKPINKLDIKPTLAYLCDIPDGISIGTNMFGGKDFVCLNNERIIAKDYYYDENWYDRNTGEIIDLNSADEETKKLLDNYYQKMKKELDISNSIIVNNLLK